MPNAESLVINPFVLLTDPQTLLRQVESSERLNSLRRQIHRPLDNPVPRLNRHEAQSEFDAEVESESESEFSVPELWPPTIMK
jgi:hypothetical protein